MNFDYTDDWLEYCHNRVAYRFKLVKNTENSSKIIIYDKERDVHLEIDDANMFWRDMAQTFLLYTGKWLVFPSYIGKRTTPAAAKTAIGNDRYDVMISYEQSDQEVVSKIMGIKKSLVDHGYKMWAIEEQAQGDKYERLAEGVENSSCLLICMTEEYKNSDDCKLVI